MLRRTCLALALALLAAASTVHAAPAAEDGDTQIVEIPGTGTAATLPADWRVWVAERQGHPDVVLATDVATRQSCTFERMEGVASIERAAHETVAAVEAQPQYEVVERTFLAVPSGAAVRVAYRPKAAPDDARYVLTEYYLTVPGGVMSIYCSGDAPPADRWLSVIDDIAPSTAEPAPAGIFDPRVPIPDHGFAIDFPEAWLVRSWPGLGPVLGGQLVLRAVTAIDDGDCAGCECVLEDDTVLTAASAPGSAEEWQAALTSSTPGNRGRTAPPVVTEVELPSGPAIRADWERRSGEPSTAWIHLDGDGRAVAALLCRSDAPPEDGWRSIAQTFELLPTDA